MASTISKKRLRKLPIARGRGQTKGHAANLTNKTDWLEQARQARARTNPSSDSTEILRAFRSGENRLSSITE